MECIGKSFVFNDKLINVNEFPDELIRRNKTLYEVVRVIKGKVLFADDHIDRLFTSIEKSKREVSFNKSEIKDRLLLLIKDNKIVEGNIKIILTFDENRKSNLILCSIKFYYPPKSLYESGVNTTLFNASRSNPEIKQLIIELKNEVSKIILKTGVFEVIYFNDDGFITEGSRSNLFFIKDDTLFTASSENVLSGITRKYIIELCEILNLKVEFVKVNKSELEKFDAAFITGTSPGVIPILNIDNIKFDTKNSIYMQVHDAYFEFVDKYLRLN